MGGSAWLASCSLLTTLGQAPCPQVPWFVAAVCSCPPADGPLSQAKEALMPSPALTLGATASLSAASPIAMDALLLLPWSLRGVLVCLRDLLVQCLAVAGSGALRN